MPQKYNIGAKFDNRADKGRLHKITFEIIGYEETLSDDGDDHYEIFDGIYLRIWIKQSNLDKMYEIK